MASTAPLQPHMIKMYLNHAFIFYFLIKIKNKYVATPVPTALILRLVFNVPRLIPPPPQNPASHALAPSAHPYPTDPPPLPQRCKYCPVAYCTEHLPKSAAMVGPIAGAPVVPSPSQVALSSTTTSTEPAGMAIAVSTATVPAPDTPVPATMPATVPATVTVAADSCNGATDLMQQIICGACCMMVNRASKRGLVSEAH